MADIAANIWRDFVTNGVPSSGNHKPQKSDVRQWGAWLESFVTAIGASGSSVYLTRTELFADLSKPAKEGAWVIQDPTTAYNGIYRKNGSSGTGSWTRVGDLPYSFINAVDAGAGTPDAIQATTAIPISASSLVILTVFENSVGSPVTVSFNGGSALTIKTNSGNDIAAGGLVAGMQLLGVVSGLTFRLASDQASAAVLAQAEDAQTAAEAAAASAADDAAEVATILSGVQMLGDGSAFPQGRLTLTSGVAVPESDVVGATTIYYVSGGTGRYVPRWNGTAVLPMNITAGLSQPLDSNAAHTNYHQSGFNFDEFVFLDGSTVRLGSGPSWAAGAVAGSDTARGTGAGSTELELFQGILVNKNSIVLRWGSGASDTTTIPARQATYVGSFRTIANGQTTDSKEKRLLFNAYNQTLRMMARYDAAASWVYTTSAWRQANGNTANKLQVLFGLAGNLLEAVCTLTANNTSGSTATLVGTRLQFSGVDLPDGAISGIAYTAAAASGRGTAHGHYRGYPGIGFRELIWMELGAADMTMLNVQTYLKSGVVGSVMA
jgi:hypothetical protein